MIKVPVYNLEGKKVKDLELAKDIFGIEVKQEVMHKVVVAQLSNKRNVVASTKGRSEVRGGGRKPWKQKGTGRARHGSNRSPIWVGGGIVFGPTASRNFKKKINKKENKKALFMSLSQKVIDEKLIIAEDIKADKISTKGFLKKIEKLPLKGGNTLLMLDKKNEIISKSIRNVEKIKYISIDNINIYDVLRYDYLLLTPEVIKKIEENYK